ncbi:MAG TPA: carbohydrate ABC transporter permease [Rectinemataceae bacterium]|nr:carbohydrate ABC transporter permease [Rectinemataceae bacterium]
MGKLPLTLGDGRHDVRRISTGTLLLYFILILFAITMLLPFFWMASASLQMDKDVFRFPFQWIPKQPRWKNYLLIWKRIPFLTFFLNTAKLAVIITALQLFTSSLAAYAFARLEFRGKDLLFLGYIGTIAIPWQVYMVPQFIMMRKLGLNDSHTALVLLQTFSAFGVFLMRQFFIGIPKELSDAARIDGLGDYAIFARIVIPLSKPALATLTIFSFVTVWNDFMGPLIYLSTERLKTIQLGLRMFIAEYSAEYSLIMAASLVSVLPIMILFLFLQRFYIEGVASSGIKG